MAARVRAHCERDWGNVRDYFRTLVGEKQGAEAIERQWVAQEQASREPIEMLFP